MLWVNSLKSITYTVFAVCEEIQIEGIYTYKYKEGPHDEWSSEMLSAP